MLKYRLIMNFIFILNVSVFTNILLTDAARILGIVLFPSFSHQIVFRPIWRELSLRKHQLVVLTTDPMNDPELTNLIEIDLHFSYDIWAKHMTPLMVNANPPEEIIANAVETMNKVTERQLSHPDVRKLLDNDEDRFDIVMVEMLVPFVAAFSARFNCPYIGLVSGDPPSFLYTSFGNPVHPISNPDCNLPYVGKLNFLERLQCVVYDIILNNIAVGYVQDQQALVEKHISKGLPHLNDLLANVSLFFINTNPFLNQARSLLPNVVQIGDGIHLTSTKKLPRDLQGYLDNASQGFIYFSLGSNVKSKDLTSDVTSILLEAFAEIPYKILWKFELDDLPNKPNNVIISKWFPQQDILHHPNIKLFITQGGLQSIDEAIYGHVPMLGVPFFLDQVPNIKRMVAKGLGLSLDFKTLEKETLKKTITEIINNPKYREKAKQLADLIKDQPMTGLEKALWWTEYLIRHKDAKHLKSPLIDKPAY